MKILSWSNVHRRTIFVRKTIGYAALIALSAMLVGQPASAQVSLIAKGTLTSSSAGSYADLSGLSGTLENGARANLLGGIGSGMTWAGGNTFLAVPDRGPNAVLYNPLVDDTVTFIPRFHTIQMSLQPSAGALPFSVTPSLESTTLLYSASPLVYGSGEGLGLGSGAPAENRPSHNYFSGRSDNFDPNQNSGYGKDARFDAESIRVSRDGRMVYISDEYGPYVYEFRRSTGQRIRTFRLPDHLFVSNLSTVGNTEISGNTSGRTANKGMESLAITPDGKTLVGMMQAAIVQDALEAGAAANLLRVVTIDIETGKTTHEYAYLLTTGSGVSDVVALNDHEFLVDERDGKGLGDGSKAKIKQIFKMDLADATDVSEMDGLEAATHAVPKTLFLDIVKVLNANGIIAEQIPAKLEGIALGPDVTNGSTTLHTLWVANDNDFLENYSGPNTNPNQFFVFGFTNADLAGSTYVPQEFK
jgi:phytase-like protein